MNKRFSDVGVNRMRPEIPVGIVVGLLAAVWKVALEGYSWEAFGLFIVVAVLIEWLGSIFLQRSHDVTKQDIYLQAKMIRDKIRGFDDGEK